MKLLCAFNFHRPEAEDLWNRGYYFNRCARCGSDLLRTDGRWQPAPRGHRVVWKSGRHAHSIPSRFTRNLPAPCATPGQARAAILIETLRPRARGAREARPSLAVVE